MRPSVLVLDDEPQVLKSLERALYKDFDIHVFTSAEKALSFFSLQPTHIVISDMKMPEMPGEAFLAHIKNISPDTKCCVLTGYADAEAAQKAINLANVSAYFSKPWVNGELKDKLVDLSFELLAKQKRAKKLQTLEKRNAKSIAKNSAISRVVQDMLNQRDEVRENLSQKNETNKQLLHLVANLVASQCGDTPEHLYRVANYAKALAKALALTEPEATQVYLAAVLHRVGQIGADNEIFDKPLINYSRDDEVLLLTLNANSVELLQMVDILKPCAHLISFLFSQWHSLKSQEESQVSAEPIAAKVLRHAIYFDYAVRGQLSGEVMSVDRALVYLKSYHNGFFEVAILNKLQQLFVQANDLQIERPKLIGELKEKMTLSEDLLNPAGQLLLAKGVCLTQSQIEQLKLVEENIEQQMIAFVVGN